MKCTSNRIRLTSLILCLMVSLGLCGCGETSYQMPYDADSDVSSFNVISAQRSEAARGFAYDLCIVTGDITDDERVDMSEASAAMLCDLDRREVLYAKNANERLYPASLTKIMTAIIALKYGSVDSTLTATDAVNITESGAQVAGIKVGDSMTLNQALYVLLLYSANDVAMMIAENVAGSVEAFVELMNEEAQAIGATNTHFANPHGLTDETHYTTAYDLYLILNEALQYDMFQEIIHTGSYQTAYRKANGDPEQLSFRNTNRFINGDVKAPDHVTVVGGKTGTTAAAGHCLILLTRDNSGASYISVILGSASTDSLYSEMTDLLNEIQN